MPKQKLVPDLEAAISEKGFCGRDWGSRYLESLRKAGERRRASSKRAYEAVWRSYLRYLASQGMDGPGASQQAAAAFLDGLSNATTRLRYGRLLKAIYACAVSRGDLEGNPFDQVSGLRSQADKRTPVQVPRVDSVRALIRRLPAPHDWKEHRDQAVVVLCAAAGLRLREVLELDTLQFVGNTVQPKGSTVQTRELELPGEAQAFLQEWLVARRESGVTGRLAFPARDGAKLPVNTLYRRVRKVLQVVCAEGGLEHYGVGTLRAFFAKSFPEPVQARYGLGHRRLNSTLRYLKQIKVAPAASGHKKHPEE